LLREGKKSGVLILRVKGISGELPKRMVLISLD
jgi:hypothetical protein